MISRMTTTDTSGTLAANPDVALLDDEPFWVEAQERNADEVFGTAVLERGLAVPRHRGPITVHEWLSEFALRGLLLVEHASEVAGLRLAKRMLLPVHAVGVESSDGVSVVLAPTALPRIRPALRSLLRVHVSSLDPARSQPESIAARHKANTRGHPDLHNGDDRTSHAAGVPEREERARGGSQRCRSSREL